MLQNELGLSDDFPAVLAAARRGDEQAIRNVFADLQPRLLRFLRASEPRFADDLASETWLAIARNLHSFAGDHHQFLAWAFTIARRRLADHRRAASRRPADPVDDEHLDRLPSGLDPERDAVAQLSAEEAARLITRLLPADQAEVVLLRVIADLDVADVAGIVGRSENWVRVTQHRAVRRLADRLGTKIGVTG